MNHITPRKIWPVLMESPTTDLTTKTFIPTGGVNGGNVGEYAAAPFIHAVGGSWVCAKADIKATKY